MSSAPPASAVPVPPGLVLAPFRALRYDPGVVPDLAAVLSPPYDVIDDAQRAALAASSEHNAVRLILPVGTDEQPDRYATATALLAEWQATGVLRRDEVPALYVYEETEPGGHVQRGLLGGVGLAEAEAGIVLPHENTMAGPVADRLALLTATATDLEPIFLVYDGGGAASTAVEQAAAGDALVDVTTADGVRHRLFRITDPDTLADVAADLLPRTATIADGHHRYATYLQHQRDQHAAGRGDGPWDRGLALLVDVSRSGPAVHPIHRVIASLPVDRAAELAGAAFRVTRLRDDAADAALERLAGTHGPAFVLTNGAASYLLDSPDERVLTEVLPADRSAAFRSLDVTVAHLLLVDRLWGLRDHEDVVGFEHDVPAAIAAAGAGGTALLLKPTPVEDVAAVARAGERMPRKSTLFTPKPRSGMVLRPHDDG
ncbi:MAG TPA: DUF1015 domain-containing protein [Mycobacteriales bacterium]|nr:DUF1015 domain-containing protein [Mycobacteriales bacterium]